MTANLTDWRDTAQARMAVRFQHDRIKALKAEERDRRVREHRDRIEALERLPASVPPEPHSCPSLEIASASVPVQVPLTTAPDAPPRISRPIIVPPSVPPHLVEQFVLAVEQADPLRLSLSPTRHRAHVEARFAVARVLYERGWLLIDISRAFGLDHSCFQRSRLGVRPKPPTSDAERMLREAVHACPELLARNGDGYLSRRGDLPEKRRGLFYAMYASCPSWTDVARLVQTGHATVHNGVHAHAKKHGLDVPTPHHQMTVRKESRAAEPHEANLTFDAPNGR